MSIEEDATNEGLSRRGLLGGLLVALAAAPLLAAAPGEAAEREFVRPSHTPRVQRPRSPLRGPRTHRSLFRLRRRIRPAVPR